VSRKPLPVRFLAILVLIGFSGMGRSPAQAQTSTTAPTANKFEVASIKPSDPNAQGRQVGWVGPGRFAARNVSVRSLLLLGYSISDFQIADLPGWVNTQGFDIDAKSDYPAKGAELVPLVKALLIDRFRLKAHIESKEHSVYELAVSKGGPKLRQVEGNAIPQQASGSTSGSIVGPGMSMQKLASALTYRLGRVVVDRTDLSGNYDVNLEWTPDPNVATAWGASPGTTTDPAGPSIFTALREQLGLEVKPSKGRIEILVVDSIEKPTAN
jgi:uncharacterized protein (TIGR03435 family)